MAFCYLIYFVLQTLKIKVKKKGNPKYKKEIPGHSAKHQFNFKPNHLGKIVKFLFEN